MTIHHRLGVNSGAPGTVLRLADEYRNHGHEVDVTGFDDIPRFFPRRMHHPVFPFHLAWNLLRRGVYDVVDASSGDAWLWGKLRSQGQRPVYVFRSHGLEQVVHDALVAERDAGNIQLSWKYPIYWGGWNLWTVASSARSADHCFFLNGEDREYAIDKLAMDAGKCSVSPNGINQGLLGCINEREEGVDESVGVAFIGSYIERKGIYYLMPAMGQLMQRQPRLRFSLLGTGVEESAVLRDVPPKLRQRVKVIKRFEQEDLPRLLQGHHIVLIPSVAEGFGKAMVEGMACGLAPIGTEGTGFASFIQHEQNGLLIPRRSTQAIIDAVERLIARPQELQRFREAARETAKLYTWERVAKQRLAVYERLLSERRG